MGRWDKDEQDEPEKPVSHHHYFFKERAKHPIPGEEAGARVGATSGEDEEDDDDEDEKEGITGEDTDTWLPPILDP